MFNALWEKQRRRLLTNIKVVATGCMEGCLAGPALLVVPDNVWYGGDRGGRSRHRGAGTWSGEPVEMLRIGSKDF